MDKVRRILLVCAVAAGVVSGPIVALADSGFCEGYKDGYAEGWCYGDSYCLKPLPPLCPLPNLGESGYKAGYNRGFIEGSQARQASR